MQYGFVFDQSRCMGCNACTVSCKDWNQVKSGLVRWRKHVGHEKTNEGYDVTTRTSILQNVENLVMSFNHCDRPACVKACSSNAISKDANTGIVSIDREKCIGVLACITACPFGAIGIADDYQEPEKQGGWQISHPAQKCNMCIDRVNDGQEPVCVASCVGRAIHWGPIDELKRDYPAAVTINKNKFPYAYQNDNEDTGPSFLIIPRNPLNIIFKTH